MIIINNLENPIICSLIALILFACNLLLPSNDCSLRCFLRPCGLWEHWLKSKWLTSSQVSQALQSCHDLILCLSAPSAPLIDPKWRESCSGELAPPADHSWTSSLMRLEDESTNTVVLTFLYPLRRERSTNVLFYCEDSKKRNYFKGLK